jgi:class 3 adenylate cyclase
VLSSSRQNLLEPHRRQIAVVFCDLRGWTSFSEHVEPEEVLNVVREYHEALGKLIFRFGGTVGYYTGDGAMVFFNDPIPCPDPAARAVRMATDMRKSMKSMTLRWRRHGYDLGFGVGIAFGYATLGQIGFEGRFEYGAIGSVINLAARLCGEAKSGQILVSQRIYALVDDIVEVEEIAELSLKGFNKPVRAYNILSVRALEARDRRVTKSLLETGALLKG